MDCSDATDSERERISRRLHRDGNIVCVEERGGERQTEFALADETVDTARTTRDFGVLRACHTADVDDAEAHVGVRIDERENLLVRVRGRIVFAVGENSDDGATRLVTNLRHGDPDCVPERSAAFGKDALEQRRELVLATQLTDGTWLELKVRLCIERDQRHAVVLVHRWHNVVEQCRFRLLETRAGHRGRHVDQRVPVGRARHPASHSQTPVSKRKGTCCWQRPRRHGSSRRGEDGDVGLKVARAAHTARIWTRDRTMIHDIANARPAVVTLLQRLAVKAVLFRVAALAALVARAVKFRETHC